MQHPHKSCLYPYADPTPQQIDEDAFMLEHGGAGPVFIYQMVVLIAGSWSAFGAAVRTYRTPQLGSARPRHVAQDQ